MSDIPRFVEIHEEGPREGFQIEKGPISTERKIELIDELSQTGLREIQVVSFVNPKRVPGWADAEQVVAGFTRRSGVRYTALWLNGKGLERAIATGRLDVMGGIALCPTEKFLKLNQNRTLAENIDAQLDRIQVFKRHGIAIERAGITAAFGCNYEGDMPNQAVVDLIDKLLQLAGENGSTIKTLRLSDTMAWANPLSIKRLVGAVREQYPSLRVALHLHDTRGMAIANAFAGLEMGVDLFDAAVGGLGGCPFANHKGAAGNVCTEDLVFMCQEMGIETGVDLERLIEVGQLAEVIVGHPLPGSVKVGGSLQTLREKIAAAQAA
ncbi:MAG: hydroxymethylglutaryl-CoA lyase [Acidobacteriota bacterium]|nr:hydroxymethylglutaryl-CoA lyase [Acidobacteriota bacterium]